MNDIIDKYPDDITDTVKDEIRNRYRLEAQKGMGRTFYKTHIIRTLLKSNINSTCSSCVYYMNDQCQHPKGMVPIDNLSACPLGHWEKPHVV